MKIFNRIPLELIIWITVLIALATATPSDHFHKPDFTLCPYTNLGFKWCPGCGLGRSITHLFRGNVQESLKMHVLGIPALLLICARIVTLTRLKIKENIYTDLN